MPQFFVDKGFEVGKEVEIGGQDASHISQVLRLTTGDWIILSDGGGRSFRATITQSGAKQVQAVIKEEIAQKLDRPFPTLALATIKSDRFEWAIEKAVELGSRVIIPFTSDRTVPKYKEGVTPKKIERWQKIAMAAAKQSGLPFIPKIDGLVSFKNLFTKDLPFGRRLFFYEGERNGDLKTSLRQKTDKTGDILIIGPEGGFSGDEVTFAKNSGAEFVGLGSQILRVETAAITAIAIWQYEMGNV